MFKLYLLYIARDTTWTLQQPASLQSAILLGKFLSYIISSIVWYLCTVRLLLNAY